MKTLIVEDNRTSGKLLQAVLESEGFETELADDGQEALDALERSKVDCIISDVMMPNVDGYRLVYKVRKNEKFKDIPFIMYTASYSSEDDEQFAVSLGVNKYIRKPGSAKDIVRAIRDLIESRNENAGSFDIRSARDNWVMKKYGKLLIDKLEQKIDELERTKLQLEWNEQKLTEAYDTLENKSKLLADNQEQIERLNSSLSAFKNAINHASLVSIADKTGIITSVNRKFVEISGYSESELLGQNHRVVNSGHHPKSFWVDMWKTISSGHSWRSEIKNKAKDGTFYWVDAFIIPLLDSDGNVQEHLSIRNDITERKLIEEQLALRNTELVDYKNNLEHKIQERTLELYEALGKERELGALKSQFISVASHEFKTPLATINFLAGMLKKFRSKFSEKEIDQRLEAIDHQVRFMTDLLDDVLLLGRVESGKLKASLAKIDGPSFFSSIISDVLNSTGNSTPINPYIQLNGKTIVTDERLLHNIMGNLLSNAIKYSPKGKPVALTVIGMKDYLSIEIRDQGLGITEEDQGIIFEAFTRGNNVGSIPGSGLGLSIVKKALDLLGGSITITSKLNEGSVFTVTIPYTAPQING